MPNGVEDYYNLMHQPWGRMFYDMIWRQLDIPVLPRLSILDFGSGFGVTADHYARDHRVTAVEVNPEMSGRRFCIHEYSQVTGGTETLSAYRDESFDVVICHNVLEYIPEQEETFARLARVLKHGGSLSLVKHNRCGRVLAAAVFDDDPGKASNLLENREHAEHAAFGKQRIYENQNVILWGSKCGLSTAEIFGIRAFFALSRNNEIKYTDSWYKEMLALEMAACNIEEYQKIAFFNHLIFKK